jgi:hypothetical protein
MSSGILVFDDKALELGVVDTPLLLTDGSALAGVVFSVSSSFYIEGGGWLAGARTSFAGE